MANSPFQPAASDNARSSPHAQLRYKYDPYDELKDVPDNDFFTIVANHPDSLPANRRKNIPIMPAPLTPGMAPIGLGIGAGVDVAKMGGLPYVAGAPGRAAKAVMEMLQGGGMLLGGTVAAGVSAAKAFTPGISTTIRPEGFQELGQAGRAIGQAVPDVLQSIGQQTKEELTNPGAAFIRRPAETGLDALGVATLPSAVAGLASRAAAGLGKTKAAMAAMRFSEAATPAKQQAEAFRAARLAIGHLDPRVGEAIDMAGQRANNVSMTREAWANRAKDLALKKEQLTSQMDKSFGKLTKAERKAVPKIAMGLASPTKAARPELEQGVKAFQELTLEEQSALFARGSLDAATAERRAWQPIRVTVGGEEQLAAEAAPRRMNDVTGLERRAAAAEKLRDQATLRASKAAQKEAEAATLKAQLAQSHRETGAKITAERQAARYKGRSEQAQKELTSIEDIDAKILETKERLAATGHAVDSRRLSRILGFYEAKRARLVKQGTDVTKAEIGLEGSLTSAEASKAAIPGSPATIAQGLGKTKAQLSEAQRWQRVADAAEARRVRLLAKADLKRGHTPALDRLDETTRALKAEYRSADELPESVQSLVKSHPEIARDFALGKLDAGEANLKAAGPGTLIEDRTLEMLSRDLDGAKESLKQIMGVNDPTYFPMIPKDKFGWNKLVPPKFRAPVPGFLKKSTGELFASGEYEDDVAKAWTKHRAHALEMDRNVGVLNDVSKMPFSRQVNKLEEVDWTTEGMIAPGAYARGVASKIEDVDAAFRSPDPQRALADELKRALIDDELKLDPRTAEEMGPFFAVPKEVLEELNGQIGSKPSLFTRLAFDHPNTFLRWTALILRPGFYVNNLVGATSLAALGGATIKSTKATLRGQPVPVAFRGTGFAAAEAPAMPTGLGAVSKLGRVPKIINEGVDEAARSAVALGKIDNLAMRKSLLETGTRMDKAMSYNEKMDFLGPAGIDEAARATSFFINDYANQSPFQRNVLRRVLPFQSFLVHMGRLITRLPFRHPLRANLVERFSQLGNEYRDAQWRESGVNPDDLKSYRQNVMPVRSDGKTVTTMGTAGFNPASGFGTSSAEMMDDPSIGGLFRVMMGGAGPLFQYGKQVMTGDDAFGQPLTKPGVVRKYGSNQAFNEKGEPIEQPWPSPWDYVRGSVQPIKMAEAVAQPNETYDLTGSMNPLDPNYLPSVEGSQAGPRKYGVDAMATGYMGLPYRTFNKDEVVISEKEKASRAKIAAQSGKEMIELRGQLKEAKVILAAAKEAKDSVEARKQQQRINQIQNDLKQLGKRGKPK